MAKTSANGYGSTKSISNRLAQESRRAKATRKKKIKTGIFGHPVKKISKKYKA